MTPREAANLLEKESTFTAHPDSPAWAARLLAIAWMKDNPPDDDQKVDEAWLLSIGGEVFGGRATFVYPHEKESTMRIDTNPGVNPGAWIEGWNCDIALPELKTRRQVRMLLSALGITPNKRKG